MMMIWTRRKTSPWMKIARIAAIAASAAGLAIGAEMLRRKLGIGVPRVRVTARKGRVTRMRVTLSRRPKRAAVSAS